MSKEKSERIYIQAFYQNNRLLFLITMLFRLMLVPAMLLVSWLLGKVIDMITERELAVLWRLFMTAILFVVVFFFLQLGFYKTQSAFLCKAIAQYKELAFKNL